MEMNSNKSDNDCIPKYDHIMADVCTLRFTIDQKSVNKMIYVISRKKNDYY